MNDTERREHRPGFAPHRLCSGSGNGERANAGVPLKLNARQVALLRRIVEDREPVSSSESALAVSVYALRSRGLVITRQAGGGWVAHATDLGRLQLEQLAHQADHGTMAHSQVRRPTTTPRNAAAEAEATALVTRVQQAGGSLMFTDPDTDSRATLRATIQTAIHAGHRLHYTGRLRGDLVITLAEPAPAQLRPATDSDVKASAWRPTARRTHPVVAELRTLAAVADGVAVSDSRLPQVPRKVLPRALRLLNLFLTEAEKRGHTIRGPSPVAERPCVVRIAVRGHEFRFVLGEHGGILTLKLDGVHTGRRVWVDGARTRLEQKLGDVLDSLEERARLTEQRRREREQLAREAEIARRAESARYRAAYAHDYAIGMLRDQVAAWQLAEQIRTLCAHVHQRSADGTTPTASQAWITWALEHADHLDPARRPLTVPEIPEPTTHDLERYRNAPHPLVLEAP